MMMRLSNITQKQVAGEIGITPEYFCILMRKELPSGYREKTLKAIKKLSLESE